MTLRMIFLSAIVSLFSNFVFAAEVSQATATEQEASLFHGQGGRYYSWQCSAENSHGSYQHYYGQPSYDRHQAQHNALDACQYYEQHTCVLVDCQPSGY